MNGTGRRTNESNESIECRVGETDRRCRISSICFDCKFAVNDLTLITLTNDDSFTFMNKIHCFPTTEIHCLLYQKQPSLTTIWR
jgi:hypothetical protein